MNLPKVDWFRAAVIFGAGALFLAAMFWLGTALAADANLSWTHPTQRVDGTALPLSAIKETQIDWGACAAGNTFPATPAGTKAVPAPATTTTVTGLAYGTWCFRARTADTNNLVSDNAGTVWKQYVAPPQPPVLTVVNIVAYETKRDNRGLVRLGRHVGTVPLGTACGEYVTLKHSARYYEVPLDQVTLSKMPKSLVVVARCG